MTIPDLLGHYEIAAHLGSGAYSETYRARDISRNRAVALKLLKLDQFPEQVDPLVFLDQAQQAGDLFHPHLAWVWETGEVDGTYFIAERFIDGRSLAQVLEENGPLSYQQAQKIIGQIAQGLEFAHGLGWAHGDVKPGNILLHPELGAVLTGYGTSLAIQALGLYSNTQWLWGSSFYTAPEIWQGMQPTAAADQYALACNFVEAVSGEKFFGAPTRDEIKEKHLTEFQAPASWSVIMPWAAAKAVQRALERNPVKRFPGVRIFAEAPEKLAAEVIHDPKMFAERELQTRRWQEMQEIARKETEEASRLAALEQAKLEIEEEIQNPVQSPHAEPETGELEPAAIAAQEIPTSTPRPRKSRLARSLRWLIWVGLMLGITALLGFWLNDRASNHVLQPSETPSETPANLVATIPPQPASSTTPTGVNTATSTSTSLPTTTLTFTPTSTITMTATLSPTTTVTPAPSPTPEINNSDSISNSYRPLQTKAPPVR